jgi:hypothetical protein
MIMRVVKVMVGPAVQDCQSVVFLLTKPLKSMANLLLRHRIDQVGVGYPNETPQPQIRQSIWYLPQTNLRKDSQSLNFAPKRQVDSSEEINAPKLIAEILPVGMGTSGLQ